MRRSARSSRGSVAHRASLDRGPRAEAQSPCCGLGASVSQTGSFGTLGQGPAPRLQLCVNTRTRKVGVLGRRIEPSGRTIGRCCHGGRHPSSGDLVTHRRQVVNARWPVRPRPTPPVADVDEIACMVDGDRRGSIDRSFSPEGSIGGPGRHLSRPRA